MKFAIAPKSKAKTLGLGLKTSRFKSTKDELEPEETDSPLPCPFLTLLVIQSCTTKTRGIIIQG